MNAEQKSPRDMDLIVVNILKSWPWAKPSSFVTYLRREGDDLFGDTVRFKSVYPFSIEFKGRSPFSWEARKAERQNGLFVVQDVVDEGALGLEEEERAFPYSLTVDGETFDPEVVVKKDPRR